MPAVLIPPSTADLDRRHNPEEEEDRYGAIVVHQRGIRGKIGCVWIDGSSSQLRPSAMSREHDDGSGKTSASSRGQVAGSQDNRLIVPDGDGVLEERRARGWTREDLAHRTGYCVTTLANLEHGKPVFMSTLRVVASTFDLQVRDLMVVEPPPREEPSMESMTPYQLLQAMRQQRDEHERAMRELIERFVSSQEQHHRDGE